MQQHIITLSLALSFFMAVNPLMSTTSPFHVLNNAESIEEISDNTVEDSEEATDNESEEKVKIKVSEKTIECFKSLTIDGLNETGYKEMQIQTGGEISNGDLMMQNDKLYVCIKMDNSVVWWGLDEDEFVPYNDVTFNQDSSRVFHKKMNETAYPIISGLTGFKERPLSSIVLPDNYHWVNVNQILDHIGTVKYQAYYIPEDLINDKSRIISIPVVVKDKLEAPSFQDTYRVKYVPHLKASMVGITENWTVKPDKELEMGENTVNITYRFPNGSSVTDSVKIIVEKGDLSLDGVMITVIEGTKLSNDLLPTMSNGYLQFDEDEGKIVLQNTTSKCRFIPEEADKYNEISNIAVIINVIPKSFISPTKPEDDPSQEEEQKQEDTTEDQQDTEEQSTEDTTEEDQQDDNTPSNTEQENKDDKGESEKKPIDIDSSKRQEESTGDKSKQETSRTPASSQTSNQSNTTNKPTVEVASAKTDKRTATTTNNTQEKNIKMHDIDLTITKDKDNAVKIPVKDIELVKVENPEVSLPVKKPIVKTITLTKKVHTETDATTEITSETTIETTEELTTQEATMTDGEQDTTESNEKSSDESSDEKDSTMIIIVLLCTALLTGGGIIAYRLLKRKKFK